MGERSSDILDVNKNGDKHKINNNNDEKNKLQDKNRTDKKNEIDGKIDEAQDDDHENKKEDEYDDSFCLLTDGALIIADNTLWKGMVLGQVR